MDKKALAEHEIKVGNRRFRMRVCDTDTNIPCLEITVHGLKDGLWFEKAAFSLDCENIWAFSMLFSASLYDFMLMWEPACQQLINPCEFNRDGVYWSKPEVKKLRDMLVQSIDIETIARCVNRSPEGVRRKIRKLENREYSQKQKQINGFRAYEKWTPEEEEQLLSEYKQRIPIRKIARIHRRGKKGIEMRLKKLGIVDIDYDQMPPSARTGRNT